jgi:transposase InsO family protein
MHNKGNSWDNAIAERFFVTLKMERVRQRNYANHAHSKLGGGQLHRRLLQL